MGVPRAHEGGIGLPRHQDIIGVIAGSAHEPQILEARHGAPDEGTASVGRRNAIVLRHRAPTPPQRSIHSPISLSKHARRCQLAAAVVYDRGRALRYSPPCRARAEGVTAMGIVEKTQAKASVADFGRFRLRRFIEGLGDELETLRAASNALWQKRSRSRRRGTLFHQIRIARSRAMGEAE